LLPYLLAKTFQPTERTKRETDSDRLGMIRRVCKRRPDSHWQQLGWMERCASWSAIVCGRRHTVNKVGGMLRRKGLPGVGLRVSPQPAGLTARPVAALIPGLGALDEGKNQASNGGFDGRRGLAEKFYRRPVAPSLERAGWSLRPPVVALLWPLEPDEIGRASCRERV